MKRRSFLVSTGSLVFVGCSSGEVDGGGATSTLVPLESTESLDLVVMFSPTVLAAGIPQRLPFGLMRDGAFVLGTDGSDEVLVRLVNVATGETAIEQKVSGRAVAHNHTEGTTANHDHGGVVRYFAPSVTFPEPGEYRIIVESGSQSTELGLTARPASEVNVPGVGQPMRSIVTATNDDPLGVRPLCTREPPCEFHNDTPAQLLNAGKPFALLVATPAYCQTQFCGPVLDVLIDIQPEFPDVTFIHAEVYANPDEVGGDISDPNLRVASVLGDLALEFEPSLFIVQSDGLVKTRIDNVFDDVELRAALADLT